MARDVVDGVVEQGECDFVSDVAGALPSHVIAELLGIPLEDGLRLYELTEITNSGSGRRWERARHRGRQSRCSPTQQNSRARKRAQPGDDIATSLLHAEVDGQRLTDLEFNLFFILLINAGGDTTRNLVAGGMCVLMEQSRGAGEAGSGPVARCRQRSRRCCATSAPSSRSSARPQRTPNCAACAVKKGDRAAMFYPSANRDETHFADPDRFDVSRSPNPHVAFGGGGTHFCLGANLARVEATALVSEVLSRMKNLELRRAGRAHAVDLDQRHSLHAGAVHACSTRGTAGSPILTPACCPLALLRAECSFGVLAAGA